MDNNKEDQKLEQNIQEFINKDSQYENYKLTSFPTTMSCSQAFEELYQCYSVGGQFRNVYRYGEMNACKDKRAKMMFCIKMKMADEEESKVKIAEFYKSQLAAKLAAHGSSEDIWTRRAKPLNKPFLEE